MSTMYAALLKITITLVLLIIVRTNTTNDICLWNATYNGVGSPTFLYNGLYRYVSELNGKPYYKIDRSDLDCTDGYFYIFYDLITNKWTLDPNPRAPYPRGTCPQTFIALPTDCSPNTWVIGTSSFSTDPGIAIFANVNGTHSNPCPSLECDSITVTDTHDTITGCAGIFSQIGYNKFQKSGTGITWYFNIPYFNWLCVDANINAVPDTITGNCRQEFSYGANYPGRVMDIGFEQILATNGGLMYIDPNNGTTQYHVTFTCTGGGHSNFLSKQPTSPNPTFAPTAKPTKEPTVTLTNDPTMAPTTKQPTTATPTGAPTGDYCARFREIPLETCFKTTSDVSSGYYASEYYRCDAFDSSKVRKYWWSNANCSGEFPSYYMSYDCDGDCFCGGDPDKCDIGAFTAYHCDSDQVITTKVVLNACSKIDGSSSSSASFTCDSRNLVSYNAFHTNAHCNGEPFAGTTYLDTEVCGNAASCGNQCGAFYYLTFCDGTDIVDDNTTYTIHTGGAAVGIRETAQILLLLFLIWGI